MKELTKLEQGIHVEISQEEWKRLLKIFPQGVLNNENYIPQYLDIALNNELGRFMQFRFFLK